MKVAGKIRNNCADLFYKNQQIFSGFALSSRKQSSILDGHSGCSFSSTSLFATGA
jgi:hypothetical protein